MDFKPTQSSIFYVVAFLVLCLAFTAFTGWVNNIYDGDVATLSHR